MISLLSRLLMWIFGLSTPITLFCLPFLGVLLIIISFFIGVGDFNLQIPDNKTKQVGYIFALNWSFSFVLGFPIMMFFMVEAVTGQTRTLDRLVDRGMIVDKSWRPVDINAIRNEFRRFWKKAAIASAILFIFSMGYCLAEWYLLSGRYLFGSGTPLRLNETHHFFELDWSLAAVLPGPDQNAFDFRMQTAAFSFINYFLLGFYFWIVLTFYAMVVIYSDFFSGLSRGKSAEGMRIIPDIDDDEPRRGFSVFEPVFQRVLFATMVGFSLCYFMNIQNLFLRSESSNIVTFISEDIIAGFSLVFNRKFAEGLSEIATSLFDLGHTLNVTSVWAIIIVYFVLSVILCGTAWLLREVARRSRENLQVYVRDDAAPIQMFTQSKMAVCRERVKAWSTESQQGMKVWPFGWPSLRRLLSWSLFGAICIVFYRIGLVFVGITIAWVIWFMFEAFYRRQ